MTLRRILPVLLSGLALGLVGLAGPATARVSSEPPPDVTTEITDDVGALGDRTGEVQDAIDRLAQDTSFQLFVVFVDSFDGQDPIDWANTSATDSGLGVDDLLLAVAVGDRRYGVSADGGITLTDTQLANVETQVEDQLRADDWAGAAIAAADGYRDAAGGGDGITTDSAGGGFPWLPVVIVAAAVVGLVLLLRRKRPAGVVRGPDGKPLTGPAALPTAELATVAARGLVAVDDALKASESELGFAQAQFGMQATAPFTEVLAAGKQKLARAFELRHQLDDATPETEPERRTMLLEIVRLCDETDTSLDAQTAEFARLRDLQARAPQVLAELDQRAAEVQGRLPASQAALDQLAATYPATALASVTGSIEQATTLLTGARENVAAGQTAVETDRAKAVALARVAEDAVAKAALLLDGVDRAGTDLAQAGARIDTALASLGSDVADADRLAPADPAVGPAATTARTAIAAAQAERTTGDPLALLRRLAESEAALDAALAPARDHAEKVARADAQLTASLGRATSLITAASGYIDSHRTDVGADARTRLAEAARLAGAAEQARASDPLAALSTAQQAEQLATSAQQLAEADVDRARPAPSTGGGFPGGMLGSSGGGGWGGSGGSWGGSGGGWGSSGGGRAIGRSISSSGGRSHSSPVRRSSGSSHSSGGGGGRSRRGGGGRF